MKNVVIKTVDGNPTLGNPLTQNSGIVNSSVINWIIKEVPEDVSAQDVINKFKNSIIVAGGNYLMTWTQLNVKTGTPIFLNRI